MKKHFLPVFLLLLGFTFLFSACGDEAVNPGVPAEPGLVIGSVRDALSNQPLSGVSVAVSRGGTTLATTSTDAQGNFEFSVPGASDYIITFQLATYRVAIYERVLVVSNQTTFLAAVLQISQGISGNGNMAGFIKNALNGQGVSGLSLKIRAGINAGSGAILAQSSTTTNGAYQFNDLPTGHYTIEASGSGFYTLYFTVLSLGGTSINNQNASISPLNDTAKFRIVLSWGSTPSDLDAHLTGPLSSGDRFHAFYSNRSPAGSAVMLDVDDVTSYGPETFTIEDERSGMYRYSVHNYTNRSSSNSNALALSGARVQVYSQGQLMAEFFVPNQSGTLWTVFEIVNGNIVPVNQMSYENTPSDIERSQLQTTDAQWLWNLPKK
ncbi:MAG: hypothetical protein HC913_12240 [Microscillaceae bacterium]|nr:hypothetical protein [Microscillaceae bacterium]